MVRTLLIEPALASAQPLGMLGQDPSSRVDTAPCQGAWLRELSMEWLSDLCLPLEQIFLFSALPVQLHRAVLQLGSGGRKKLG